MGVILSSVKQTAIVARNRVCGVYDLFSHEGELHETVIRNFEFDVETHYRRGEFYDHPEPSPRRVIR